MEMGMIVPKSMIWNNDNSTDVEIFHYNDIDKN